MSAIGIPLLGLLAGGAAAGGAAYLTKKVVDGANTRSMEKANAMAPDFANQIQQTSRERALAAQTAELARSQAAAKANTALGPNNKRRSLLAPGVVTSNLGVTGSGNYGSSILGN